jgi:hypothetical protein
MSYQHTHPMADANILLALTGSEMVQSNENEHAAKLARFKLWMALLCLAGVGVACNLLASFYFTNWLEPILRELGAALIVAAVIGGTVDQFFKQEFARDAFLAAFRYVLPEEFKTEVERILRYAFVCESQIWRVTVEKTETPEVVKVITSWERAIENKTSSSQTKCGLYTVPEFNFSNGKSEIIECSIHGEKQKIDEFGVVNHGRYLEATTRDIEIGSGKKAKLWGKAVQYRRCNDVVYEVFGTPATNPEIEVILPDDMDYHAEFGTVGDVDVERFPPKRHKLKGVYFPGQVMLVQWWPKK